VVELKSGQNRLAALLVVTRWIRVVWPVVFLIPLGVLAGRFCTFSITDPIYHGLVGAHEWIWAIWAGLALLSVTSAAWQLLAAEREVGPLLRFACDPPRDIRATFDGCCTQLGMPAGLVFIALPNPIAFAHWRGRAVVLSAGMVSELSPEDIGLVMRHELLHLRRADQWRAFAWNMFFAMLVLPGFRAVEQILNRRREHAVDDACRIGHEAAYAQLLLRNSPRRDGLYGSICTSSAGIPGLAGLNLPPDYLTDRSLPAIVAVTVLALVLFSQILFIAALPYLQANHC